VDKWTACFLLIAGAALAGCQGRTTEAAPPTPDEATATFEPAPTQPAERETPPTPEEAGSDSAACELNPRLLIGSWGVVAADEGAVLRSAPGTGEGSHPIETYPPGTTLTILDGPVCLEGINWWQVAADEVSGWMAEGEAGTYWIDQFNIELPPEPTES